MSSTPSTSSWRALFQRPPQREAWSALDGIRALLALGVLLAHLNIFLTIAVGKENSLQYYSTNPLWVRSLLCFCHFWGDFDFEVERELAWLRVLRRRLEEEEVRMARMH